MYLEGQKTYLSFAIEAAKDQSWRDPIKKVLREHYKLDLFDPLEDVKQARFSELQQARLDCDYDTIARIAKDFLKKDLSIVDESRILIAYLPATVRTFGLTHEIINANNLKKPVLMVCPEGKNFIPSWFFGFINHNNMFDNWQQLYNYLDDVNAGKYKDNNRWARVYGLI